MLPPIVTSVLATAEARTPPDTNMDPRTTAATVPPNPIIINLFQFFSTGQIYSFQQLLLHYVQLLAHDHA
jgi:hypothetical protein